MSDVDAIRQDDASPPGDRHPLLVKLFLICAGYIVAVAAATIVTVALILAPTALPDNGAQGSFFRTVAELAPGMLVVGFGWTFLCALPGFVVAIVIGEKSRWSRWGAYALAGLFNVIPALAIFLAFAGTPFFAMVVASFPGGFAGGTAYWAVAGRFVARRRGKPA